MQTFKTKSKNPFFTLKQIFTEYRFNAKAWQQIMWSWFKLKLLSFQLEELLFEIIKSYSLEIFWNYFCTQISQSIF